MQRCNAHAYLGKVLAEGGYILGCEACQQVVVQAVQLSLDILRQLDIHLRCGQVDLDHPPVTSHSMFTPVFTATHPAIFILLVAATH